MSKSSERGVIAQSLLLLLLVAGVIVGVYLVQNRTNWLPKASVSGPVNPTTSFALSPNKSTPNVGEEVEIRVIVRADVAAANLFTANINYDKDLLLLSRISYSDTFVKNWVEQYSDQSTGTLSLVGGVPNPGFQTPTGSTATMASISFKAVRSGTAAISFSGTSAIYSNAENINILTEKEGAVITISSSTSQPAAPPAVSPTPAPIPTAAPNICRSTLKTFETQGYCGDYQTSNEVISKTAFYQSATFTCEDGYSSSVGNYPSCQAGPVLRAEATKICEDHTCSQPKGIGDANMDGKVDLVDLSILLSDLNKTSGFRKQIDLNGDGKINTFDFSLMRNLLIEKGVIKG